MTSLFPEPSTIAADTVRHVLTRQETSMSFYAIRIATHLGIYHREIGFNEAPAILEAALQYYDSARDRSALTSRFTDGWTDLLRLLAARAAARLEITIRKLLKTPSRRAIAIYNFYGGDNGTGTIIGNGYGNVVELNKDAVDGRALELHDNVAILARWVHMQGLLHSERPGIDSQTIYSEVYVNTLVPYYENLTRQPPSGQQVVRFWTFLDLEYTEYWFYFLQVANEVAMYKMTLALQRLQTILHQISPQADELSSVNMNSTFSSHRKHVWIQVEQLIWEYMHDYSSYTARPILLVQRSAAVMDGLSLVSNMDGIACDDMAD